MFTIKAGGAVDWLVYVRVWLRLVEAVTKWCQLLAMRASDEAPLQSHVCRLCVCWQLPTASTSTCTQWTSAV